MGETVTLNANATFVAVWVEAPSEAFVNGTFANDIQTVSSAAGETVESLNSAYDGK